MFLRLLSRWFDRPPTKGLRRELYFLDKAIVSTQRRINEIHSGETPVCCYYCAYPELSRMVDKQTRRVERRNQLLKKLGNK